MGISASKSIGQTLGRFTVIAVQKMPDGKAIATAKCSCGTVKKVRLTDLRTGQVMSCGCLLKERTTTHGKSKTPEYQAWHSILKRLGIGVGRKPRKNYTGCTISDEWLSFDKFYADMGKRPSNKHSLDKDIKIPGNRHYSKETCMWATREEQANARSNTLRVMHDGKLVAFMEIYNNSKTVLSPRAVRLRLKRGATVLNALYSPVK